MSTSVDSSPRSRRIPGWLRPVLATVCLIGLLAVVQQPWFTSGRDADISGDEVWTGLPMALLGAIAAGMAVMLLVGRTGRRIVALAMLGLATVVFYLSIQPRTPVGFGEDDGLRPDTAGLARYAMTAMPWLSAALAAGLALVSLSWIFAPGVVGVGRTSDGRAVPRKPGEQWALMDRGIDPTEDL